MCFTRIEMDDHSKKRLLPFALDLAQRLRCRAEAWRRAPDMLRADGDAVDLSRSPRCWRMTANCAKLTT
jgi:hypothetical protein